MQIPCSSSLGLSAARRNAVSPRASSEGIRSLRRFGNRSRPNMNVTRHGRTTPRQPPGPSRPSFGRVCLQAGAAGPGELRAEGVYTGMREIPIFPLNMVALPAATVYLNIFEARYRVLFSTLLSGDDGLEEGLINPESPFCGTREFGLSYLDQNGGLAAIGTLLHIEAHERMEDGQIQIQCMGVERYRVLEVKQERPVLICDVEFLERDSEDESDLQPLRDEVAELSRQTLRLSYKMGKMDVDESQWDLPEFRELSAHDLSCWIAYNFMQDSYSKQAMLEINSTRERLQEEAELLKKNLNYLSAASALEGAFSEDTSKPSDEPKQP